jgi:phosphoglycerate dehydrogenase-like enzyme
MASDKLKGLFILPEDNLAKLFGQGADQAIGELVELVAPRQDRESVVTNCPQLAEIDVLFSGWGAPTLDEAFLTAAPNLKAVFYGAGSIRGIVTDAMWERGVRISSAWRGNAVPVAEFTVAQIVMALKLTWHFARGIRTNKHWDHWLPIIGAFGSTVGLISLGEIGRRVAEMLKQYDVKVIAYDPFVSAEDAAELGVTLVSLEEVFSADVVSLHAPNLPETKGLIRGEHLAAMRENGTFINTARGAIVREDEMLAVLQDRPDLMAVLDVVFPEPPVEDSPLFELENVVLTPHIAGSMGPECARMGWMMVDELKRYLTSEPLQHEVTRERFQTMA